MKESSVRIFDTTLRDGEQTPGVSLTAEEKVKIARQLDKLGVNAVEAGFPIASKGERESVAAVAAAGLSCEVVGLARASRADVDAALDSQVGCVHVFLATSDMHLKYKLNLQEKRFFRESQIQSPMRNRTAYLLNIRLKMQPAPISSS